MADNFLEFLLDIECRVLKNRIDDKSDDTSLSFAGRRAMFRPDSVIPKQMATFIVFLF